MFEIQNVLTYKSVLAIQLLQIVDFLIFYIKHMSHNLINQINLVLNLFYFNILPQTQTFYNLIYR